MARAFRRSIKATADGGFSGLHWVLWWALQGPNSPTSGALWPQRISRIHWRVCVVCPFSTTSSTLGVEREGSRQSHRQKRRELEDAMK